MRVTVAIVAFGNAVEVAACLDALAHSEHQDFDVLICENGGAQAYDRLRELLPASLPGGQPVRIVLAPGNLGYAGGVNLCLSETREADAWWILNPDTQPSPIALSGMVDRLARGDCDAVGNTVHLLNGTVQSHGGRWRKSLARAVSIGHGASRGQPVDSAAVEGAQNYLNGASMLVSRRFVEVTGPMRDEYFLYCEEVEWCLRAARLGLKLGYAPQAPVLHAQGTSTGHTSDLKRRSRLSVYLGERNRLLLTRDCYPSALLPVAAIAALALLSLRFGRRRAWRQLAFALEGWWAGVRNERGPPPGMPTPTPAP